MKKISKAFIIAIFILFANQSMYAYSINSTPVKLTNEIKKIQSENGGVIGVYAKNQYTHHVIKQNHRFLFPICSVYKIFVVAAILKKSMTDTNLLDKKVKILKNEITGYSPITSKYIGKEISIKKLSRASILSDSTATNILVKELGGLDNLNTFIESLSDDVTKIVNNEPEINNVKLNSQYNKSHPMRLGRDIHKLAFGNKILDKKHSQLFRKWLQENNTGENRIKKVLPKNWKIGDKTGTCDYGTTNDVAIIWTPKNQHITMVIMYSQAEKDSKPNDKVIQEVANLVIQQLK